MDIQKQHSWPGVEIMRGREPETCFPAPRTGRFCPDLGWCGRPRIASGRSAQDCSNQSSGLQREACCADWERLGDFHIPYSRLGSILPKATGCHCKAYPRLAASCHPVQVSLFLGFRPTLRGLQLLRSISTTPVVEQTHFLMSRWPIMDNLATMFLFSSVAWVTRSAGFCRPFAMSQQCLIQDEGPHSSRSVYRVRILVKWTAVPRSPSSLNSGPRSHPRSAARRQWRTCQQEDYLT